MGKLNRLHQLTGWAVFAIATLVYLLSAERTGSLWDCGEFVLGAYKLQVVHPPGAPLYLLIGRIFAAVGDLFSSDPAGIAYAVNIMSGLCTAFAAAFVSWAAMRLSILALVGRDEAAELEPGQLGAVAGAGLVTGLATTFSSSIWFSAVEGEVYAMSLFFTTMTLWSIIRWYCKPDTPQADRWLLFTVFASGLSIGVHLLSILTWPALAIFYYLKTTKKEFSIIRVGIAAAVGVVVVALLQSIIIVGIPGMWQYFEVDMGLVNAGLPVHIGILPTLLVFGAILFFGLRYAHKNQNARLQQALVALGILITAYSTVGVVVLRAEAKTPVNMNNPDNVTSLLPYLNREQYGERSLIYGPVFTAAVTGTKTDDRYGLVNGRYEITNTKVTPTYDKKDSRLLPRMYDGSQGRPNIYKQWMGLSTNEPLPRGRPNFLDNMRFLVQYQIGWMYWRYFMWNFSGRQNGDQGYYSWDESSGNWITGIKFLDEMRLGNLDELPQADREDPARNTYYLLPFIFGLIGLIWHAKRRKGEFVGLLALFIITGIGIIIYSNQPPNEPRERDYVLVGSFFTFCMWMGMAIPALYEFVKAKFNQRGFAIAGGITAVILVAPLLMGFQNWDDHSRAEHSGARDYATNFLNSVDENAIIFTYGDNDTYPLWYAQEVEGIRRDVRVVNLSLIAVDWYINLLRYKMNDSPALKLTLSEDQLRGRTRNMVPYGNVNNPDRDCARDRQITLEQLMAEIASEKAVRLGGNTYATTYTSCNTAIQVDPRRLQQAPWLTPQNGGQQVQRMPLTINNNRLVKDEVAILDIINSNLYERPIYWAVTCQVSKLMGLQDYVQLEGLALKLTTVRNQSDRNFGLIGSGGIDVEKNRQLYQDTWKWGNFDKVDTHVNTSYKPAIQSMQLSMLRTVNALFAQGQREEAMQIADRYFEVFPDKNFPFFYQHSLMLNTYVQGQAFDRALPVAETLAKNVAEKLEFFSSLQPDVLALSYQRDNQLANDIARRLLLAADQAGDGEFKNRINALLGNYRYLIQGQNLPG